MSSNMPLQKLLAITICLLFLCVPILNFTDTPDEVHSNSEDSFSASRSVLGINSPGSERGNVFSDAVFELNSGSPTLVLDNGSLLSFVNGTSIISESNVVSISGQCSISTNYSLFCSGMNNYGHLGLGIQK